MQQELRFATFNVCNLALPGMKFYEDQIPYSAEEYDAKITWIAQQLDRLDADVIGLQEIFSQATLTDVLAKTQKYQNAHHIGFDPEASADHLTPSVALISRLPVAAGATTYTQLPNHLAINLPGVSHPVTHFTRPILHAQIEVSPELLVHVFVCHLKSKLPDYRNDINDDHPDQTGIAILRSLIRRGTDALGLRYLLSDLKKGKRTPVIVMGDFNDVADAIPTQMVMGLGKYPLNGVDDRLFESYRIQSRRDPLRDVGYTHIHDSSYETIDHILVSEEFNPTSHAAIGEVVEVIYLNDHMTLRQAHESDHGLVLVRILLHDKTVESAQSSEQNDLPSD
ncbi:endonuclease/exonuclease/phosphatase family protein [Herminiimonas arsenitoxidans]|uniref:endonuclease/exonuclease/phosphatase family protein n=1 Tax=Herminiimonas arsenitoxidans TaxID=1809410 RepID=UPI000970C876|nr:endonuclease/exonuclease/phosphatase family protein [Herminiimonas arsenitoxidans]